MAVAFHVNNASGAYVNGGATILQQDGEVYNIPSDRQVEVLPSGGDPADFYSYLDDRFKHGTWEHFG